MSYEINENSHKSVLLNEVLNFLQPQKNDIIVDATFGAGGYSKAILENSESQVIGVDRDPDVVAFADEMKGKFGDRFTFIQGQFGSLKTLLEKNKTQKIDGLVLDLGVSSMQLDTPERGFSFMHDALIDMRMGKDGISAKEVINSYKEVDLADIIYRFGEEHNSRRIAKAIVEARRKEKIETTSQLRKIIHSVSRKKGKIDSATKTFQALRIYVNKELEEIEKVLEILPEIMNINGRLVVVSFHALEDRIIKFFLRNRKGLFDILTKKVVKPEYGEVKMNSRSRSSKLRAARFKGAWL